MGFIVWFPLQTAGGEVTTWDTGVDLDVLRWVGGRSVHIPDGFSLHPTLKRGHVDARRQKLTAGSNLDWSTAESLAFGSLLYQGIELLQKDPIADSNALVR